MQNSQIPDFYLKISGVGSQGTEFLISFPHMIPVYPTVLGTLLYQFNPPAVYSFTQQHEPQTVFLFIEPAHTLKSLKGVDQ